MSDERPEFERRITRALDEEVARLDGPTRARLRQARARALESVAGDVFARHPRWWLPAGLALASLLAAVVWWGGIEQAEAPAFAPADLELLTSSEPLELYRELDFYLWLEREAKPQG